MISWSTEIGYSKKNNKYSLNFMNVDVDSKSFVNISPKVSKKLLKNIKEIIKDF